MGNEDAPEDLPCHLNMPARWYWIPAVVTQPGEAASQ